MVALSLHEYVRDAQLACKAMMKPPGVFFFLLKTLPYSNNQRVRGLRLVLFAYHESRRREQTTNTKFRFEKPFNARVYAARHSKDPPHSRVLCLLPEILEGLFFCCSPIQTLDHPTSAKHLGREAVHP